LQTAAGTISGTLKTIQVRRHCCLRGGCLLCCLMADGAVTPQEVKSTLRLTNDELRSLGQQLSTAPVLTAKLLAHHTTSIVSDSEFR
jgi:hypothetical protein